MDKTEDEGKEFEVGEEVEEVDGVGEGEEGPRMERRQGRKTRPWKHPKSTVRLNTLKKTWKTGEEERGRRMTASRVVTPPLRMAGPNERSASCARSVLLPLVTEKAWPMWAE